MMPDTHCQDDDDDDNDTDRLFFLKSAVKFVGEMCDRDI